MVALPRTALSVTRPSQGSQVRRANFRLLTHKDLTILRSDMIRVRSSRIYTRSALAHKG